MSATLYWRPVSVGRQTLDDQLRFILQLEQTRGRVRFTRTNIEYLRGLADAKVKDAQTVIDAIEKHNEIELWLEH